MSSLLRCWFCLALALVPLLGSAGAANAQVDPSTIKRVESSFATEFEEAWGVKLFVDQDFNCTDLETRNKFYIVTDNERYNRSERDVSALIVKALLVFSYQSGPTRCIFRLNTPGYSLKFHVVVIFDDEVILDMPFDKAGGHYFETAEEREQFTKKLEANFRPAEIARPDGEVGALLGSQATGYYVFREIFPVYHQTNTLSGLSLTVCATPDLAANGELLKGLGATFKRVVKMDSVGELVEGIMSGSCDIVPYSDDLAQQVEAKIAESEAFGSPDPDLIARDKLGLMEGAAAAKGSDFREFRWPRHIDLGGGDPGKRLTAKALFAGAYKACTGRLSEFGQRAFDCNCVTAKSLGRKDYAQCATGYAYNHAKYNFFDFAKSFIDPPKGSSPSEAVNFRLGLATCVAEKFDALFTESVLSGKDGGDESTWYRLLINQLKGECTR